MTDIAALAVALPRGNSKLFEYLVDDPDRLEKSVLDIMHEHMAGHMRKHLTSIIPDEAGPFLRHPLSQLAFGRRLL
jgi:hypothetical protein